MVGTLDWMPVSEHPRLLAGPVARAVGGLDGVRVAAIDPDLADTAAFCARYGVPLEVSANCVVVAAKRGGAVSHAACMIQATARADINGVVRRELGARKVSFAAMDEATALTSMEYGGITPVGLPSDWPLLVDEPIAELPAVVIGSGVRRSKLLLPGKVLASLPTARLVALALV